MDYSLHVLTKEEFQQNHDFYQESFNEIFLSNKLHLLEDWDSFYKSNPVNSIVFLKGGTKIVSLMYCCSHKSYKNFNTLNNHSVWEILYIQTHKDFQRKGYGSLVALMGIKDIVSKNGKVIDFWPICSASKRIFHNIVNPYRVGHMEPVSGLGETYRIYLNTRFRSFAKDLEFKELLRYIKY